MASDEILIRITGKYKDQITKGLAKTTSALKAVGVAATAIAAGVAAGGAALFALATKAAEAGDQFDKMSQRVGASTEFLSGLAHAADLGGASITDVEAGMRRMAKAASDADNGLETAQRSFDQLGVSVTDSNGKLKPTEQLFFEIAAALQGVESETKKAALAQEIFGRGGTALLPMLNQGTDAIREQMEEAKRLGIVYSQDSAKTSAEFIDAQARVSAALKGVVAVVGQAFMPMFTDMMNAIADWIAGNGERIKELFIEWAGILQEKLIPALTSFLGWLEKMTDATGDLSKANEKAIAEQSNLSIAWESFIGILGKVPAAYDFLVEKNAEALAFLISIPNQISSAWNQMILHIRIMWADFTNWLSGIWDSTVGLLTGAIDSISSAFQSAVDFMSGLWDRFTDGLIAAWNATAGKIGLEIAQSPSAIDRWQASLAIMEAQYAQFAASINSIRVQPAFVTPAFAGVPTFAAPTGGARGFSGGSDGATATHNTYHINVPGSGRGQERADGMRLGRDIRNALMRRDR